MDGVVSTPATALTLARIYSALVTPTRADGSLHEGALADVVSEQLTRGVEGFYCCGSSGEALLLSDAERRLVVDVVTDRVGARAPVIAHVGTLGTAATIELARAAQRSGVSAISMIPPYYYAFTAVEIEQYYLDVVAAVDVPVIVYHIPQFTGVDLAGGVIERLLAHEQIVGVKYTAHDLYRLERLSSRFPEKLMMNGFDEQYLSALTAGARATVGTTVNIQYELFAEVRRAFMAGELTAARRVQEWINDTVAELTDHGVFQAAKYLACARPEVPGDCRPPFRRLGDGDREALDRLRQLIMRRIGALARGGIGVR